MDRAAGLCSQRPVQAAGPWQVAAGPDSAPLAVGGVPQQPERAGLPGPGPPGKPWGVGAGVGPACRQPGLQSD
eukprot:5585135-Lingulodinium_polyedra.AAC.1